MEKEVAELFPGTKINRSTKWPFVLLMFVVILCGCSADNILATQGSVATLEVVKVDDGNDSVVILKANLKAPPGSKILDGELPIVVEEGESSFLLIAEMYRIPTSISPYGHDTDSAINLSFYTSRYGLTSNIHVISDSGNDPQKPIESFADFARPGIYYLSEGEKFSLSQINESELYVSVIDFP